MPPKEKRAWFEPIASETGSSVSPSSLISSSTVLRGRIASTLPWSPSERLARERQPVAVGGDDAQRVLVHREEHAVQVVADVLHRHRELHQAAAHP